LTESYKPVKMYIRSKTLKEGYYMKKEFVVTAFVNGGRRVVSNVLTYIIGKSRFKIREII